MVAANIVNLLFINNKIDKHLTFIVHKQQNWGWFFNFNDHKLTRISLRTKNIFGSASVWDIKKAMQRDEGPECMAPDNHYKILLIELELVGERELEREVLAVVEVRRPCWTDRCGSQHQRCCSCGCKLNRRSCCRCRDLRRKGSLLRRMRLRT